MQVLTSLYYTHHQTAPLPCMTAQGLHTSNTYCTATHTRRVANTQSNEQTDNPRSQGNLPGPSFQLQYPLVPPPPVSLVRLDHMPHINPAAYEAMHAYGATQGVGMDQPLTHHQAACTST
jgi:hypothetical protein